MSRPRTGRVSLACCGLAFLSILLGVSVARAQTAQPGGYLVPPAEVIIYLTPALKSRDFVAPLVCALKRVLVAPVRTSEISMAFDRTLLATPSQFDVAKVADRFMQVTTHDGEPRSFKYLLLPYDLKSPPFHYVFATSFGNQSTRYRAGVISTARLDVSNPMIEHHVGADVTALRVYKLMLKSIARLAGLASPDRCILVFPRSLNELDQKSAEFCPQDHDTLIDAGILKAQESDTADCMAISQRRPPVRMADFRDAH